MQGFSQTCDQIAASTRRLEKERILSEYLLSLNDEDLAIAVTFFTGSPFSLRDQRITNTGFAALRDVLCEIDPRAEEFLGPLLLRTGDLGAAVEQLFSTRVGQPCLTLVKVKVYFDSLAKASRNLQKREITRAILLRATPAEAKYIIKILFGDMRIGLQESLVESSMARAFKQDLTKIQFANMLLGDIGESALLARHNNLESAQMRLLHPIKPMLASPEESTEKILQYMKGQGFAEDKYDGLRAQIHKEREESKIYSRDLDDITSSFPEVINAIRSIQQSFLMDGEIVPYRDGRILGFGLLQKRLGRKTVSGEMLESIPCRYFAFDLLYHGEALLLNEPLRRRRSRLEKLQQEHPDAFFLAEQRPVQTVQQLEKAFEEARARNNEGLVIKDPDSVYVPGKRGKSWLKLKRAMLTLDVVVTLAQYGNGKRAGLLSDYTFAVKDNERLLTIGKAYSGVTDREVAQLSELFQNISLADHGFYHVVPPQVVLEVTFDRINKSNRHSSGYALRFPRIKRIRWDKNSDQIDTLETVNNLYNTHFK